MAKSFIDVVQNSPRTGLGIPVKPKKRPLSNQYTARGTAFRLYHSCHERVCSIFLPVWVYVIDIIVALSKNLLLQYENSIVL